MQGQVLINQRLIINYALVCIILAIRLIALTQIQQKCLDIVKINKNFFFCFRGSLDEFHSGVHTTEYFPQQHNFHLETNSNFVKLQLSSLCFNFSHHPILNTGWVIYPGILYIILRQKYLSFSLFLKCSQCSQNLIKSWSLIAKIR